MIGKDPCRSSGFAGRGLRGTFGFSSVNRVLQINTPLAGGMVVRLTTPEGLGRSLSELIPDLPLDGVAGYDFSWVS